MARAGVTARGNGSGTGREGEGSTPQLSCETLNGAQCEESRRKLLVRARGEGKERRELGSERKEGGSESGREG